MATRLSQLLRDSKCTFRGVDVDGLEYRATHKSETGFRDLSPEALRESLDVGNARVVFKATNPERTYAKDVWGGDLDLPNLPGARASMTAPETVKTARAKREKRSRKPATVATEPTPATESNDTVS